ncbi:MAG: ROK family protein [Nitrospirae bacterium]|nr:MAG: ROK family protein [Nitrospirota bacterium]
MRIGIDLGGTKIEGVVLDAQGRECARLRVATPREDYWATVEAVVRLVADLEHDTGVMASVGVGIPGTISPATGLVKNANSVWLIGHPLAQDLEARLNRPVRLANDADCFTISEATDGSGAGAQLVFGVILGTGVGGGICWKGAPLGGPNAITGEWGHNPLPWPEEGERPGPSCYCGLSGCIETFLSGPGLSRDHEAATGQTLSPPELQALAHTGHNQAEATLKRYEHRLARSLAMVINLLDPDVIVLGGGLSNLDRLYRHVPELWAQWIFSDRVDTKLVPPKHGDSSGVRGAAWLWPSAS